MRTAIISVACLVSLYSSRLHGQESRSSATPTTWHTAAPGPFEGVPLAKLCSSTRTTIRADGTYVPGEAYLFRIGSREVILDDRFVETDEHVLLKMNLPILEPDEILGKCLAQLREEPSRPWVNTYFDGAKTALHLLLRKKAYREAVILGNQLKGEPPLDWSYEPYQVKHNRSNGLGSGMVEAYLATGQVDKAKVIMSTWTDGRGEAEMWASVFDYERAARISMDSARKAIARYREESDENRNPLSMFQIERAVLYNGKAGKWEEATQVADLAIRETLGLFQSLKEESDGDLRREMAMDNLPEAMACWWFCHSRKTTFSSRLARWNQVNAMVSLSGTDAATMEYRFLQKLISFGLASDCEPFFERLSLPPSRLGSFDRANLFLEWGKLLIEKGDFESALGKYEAIPTFEKSPRITDVSYFKQMLLSLRVRPDESTRNFTANFIRKSLNQARKPKRSAFREHDAKSPYPLALAALIRKARPDWEFPDQTAEDIEKREKIYGLGVNLWSGKGRTVVTAVKKGGAAARQGGLKKGDQLISVDPDGAGEKLAVDVEGMNFSQVSKLISGYQGTELTVRAKKKDGGLETYTIARRKIREASADIESTIAAERISDENIRKELVDFYTKIAPFWSSLQLDHTQKMETAVTLGLALAEYGEVPKARVLAEMALEEREAKLQRMLHHPDESIRIASAQKVAQLFLLLLKSGMEQEVIDRLYLLKGGVLDAFLDDRELASRWPSGKEILDQLQRERQQLLDLELNGGQERSGQIRSIKLKIERLSQNLYDGLSRIRQAPYTPGIELDFGVDAQHAAKWPGGARLVSRIHAEKQELVELRKENQKFGRPRSIKLKNLITEKEQEIQLLTLQLDLGLSQLKEQESKPQSWSSYDQLASKLPPGTALVEFFLARSPFELADLGATYFAIVVASGEPPRIVDLGRAGEVDTLVADLQVFGPERAGGHGIENSLRKLYQKLLEPLYLASPRTTHWILSPDGSLNFVPFVALLDENDQFAGLTKQFRLLRAGRLMEVSPKKQRNGASPEISIFYRPDYAASHQPIPAQEQTSVVASNIQRRFRGVSLTDLPGTEKEALLIQELLVNRGWKATLFSGTTATEQSLRNSAPPEILHLATHGFYLPGDDTVQSENSLLPRTDNVMLRTGIFLSGSNETLSAWQTSGAPGFPGESDGVIFAAELSELSLDGTNLVVLSACETGLGDVKSGEGIMGFGRALEIAGARSALVTLWPVDDAASVELMKGFYERVSAGDPYGAALQNTQMKELSKFRSEHGLSTAIALSAPFQLIGFDASVLK